MLMSDTLVIQSHRAPLPFKWLGACVDSVKAWAQLYGFDYRWLGDELFDVLTEDQIEKTQHQKVIATDLARLKQLQSALAQGYETVVWCDADFLIFNPEKFKLPDNQRYALGREVWVQENPSDAKKLKVYTKVHNAFMFFRRGNSFLDFYTDTAEQLLDKNTGTMPPQFIGPKLLTAIHNVAQCPVLSSAGMLSPLVLKDVLVGDGRALSLFKRKSTQIIAAANLCSSLSVDEGLNDQEMAQVIDSLPTVFRSLI